MGRISYSLLPGDDDGYNNLVKYQKEIGKNAFSFIDFDKGFTDKLIHDIKSFRPEWNYTGVQKDIVSPEYALVIRNMLEDRKFQELVFTIQKSFPKTGDKQINIYCARGVDEYMFVTFYFIKKDMSRSNTWIPIEISEDLGIWQSFICDLGSDPNSFIELLKMVISKV